MKKILLTLLVVAGINLVTKAQQQFSRTAFSIGPELAIPSNSIYNIGYGASAKIELPVINKLSISLTGGYDVLHYKSALIGAFGPMEPSRFIPLKGGVRYGTGGFYLEGEMGDVIETTGNKKSLFAFSLGPGFLFRISDKQAVDLGFRYEKWSGNTLTQTGIRAAYRIGW
jgi:opacity protein-like surface antigen